VRGDILATIYPLRRLRRHLSQRERLFVSPIISQIGRENNVSAEICKHPYEKEPKGCFFLLLCLKSFAYFLGKYALNYAQYYEVEYRFDFSTEFVEGSF
jgi:hypothetical protein